MTAKLIDGKAFAAQMKKELSIEIEEHRAKGYPYPGLAVILVGEDPASHIYVRNKRQACNEVGIESFYHAFSNETDEKQIIDLIHQLNHDPKVNGILLQLPLPSHIDSEALLELIHPDKDVDGFHPYNLGRLAQRRPLLRPCTPYGVMLLLDSIQQRYKNQHAVIVGASNIVGRPMALELLLAGCTISVCHRFTHDLRHYVNDADILVSATGVPGLIQGEWIKSGATVIDVGIHRLENGSIIGDIEFDIAKKKAAWITPVPGGVGPMTTATLLKNTLIATKNQLG